MLSNRITTLFALLKCNNTDIAHWAGCSPGNISKLKRGHRTPGPDSRPIIAFAQGVYGYADYENLLPVLQELCGAEDPGREILIPALIAWLYDTEEIRLPSQNVTPKSKIEQARRRHSFGEKLDQLMTLLKLPNGQMASMLNVDKSLISRYRNGIYSPYGNKDLTEKLTSSILSYAAKAGKLEDLIEMCHIPEEMLDVDTLSEWLYESTENDEASLARLLLASLNDFTPGEGLPAVPQGLPPIDINSRYWGTAGLRSAVVRFLTDAAGEGGELLLYSDEPMDWMASDPVFFSQWASLMVNCVRSGVHIRIIHNVDRSGAEMVNAIKGWFPLYISGRIEPYVFSKMRSARFCHTVFLHKGHACIHGFFPAGSGEMRWYDYITEDLQLHALQEEYDVMLSGASPFLKVYTADMVRKYHTFCMENEGGLTCLLSGLPVAAMPEGLFRRILDRADISTEKRLTLQSLYSDVRRRFTDTLKNYNINMILMPFSQDKDIKINFSLDLLDISLYYTPEEYREHIGSMVSLVEEEQKFHLTLIPETPFTDIQLVSYKDSVTVLRSNEPYCAFVFLNPALTHAVNGYLTALIDENRQDRRSMAMELLSRYS